MANESDPDAHIRTVQLYDNKLSFELHSTPSNLEDLVVVWLDSKQKLTLENHHYINTNIRSIAAYFEICTSTDECIDLISSMVYEKVFLILFLTGAEQLIPLIHDLPQLAYIYIYKEAEEENVTDKQLYWIKKYPIVRAGVHKLNGNLSDQLRHDMESVRLRLLPYTLFSMDTTKNNSIQDLSKGQTAYRWSQLLLDALRKLPQNDRSKQDILNECKAQYHNNKQELEKIEQFEKTYQAQLAVWWYTRDCFLYKLLNKAFRTEDIDIVFKFRFFITDLYNQLTDLHNQSKSENSNIMKVYRGQQLAPDELELCKLNINGFIAMNTFFSTTTNKDVALIYAGNGSERPLFESVLFEITIDVNKSDQPLADISKISHMLNEDEVLLSMGMILKINSVVEIDNNVWEVKLISINETDIKLNDYYKYLQEELKKYEEPLLMFGSLLFEMGQYDKEEKYYLMLLDEGTDNYGPVYNNLGLCYYAKHNYRRAMDYYTKSLNHYIMIGWDKHPCCTHTYNNIGVIYQDEENYKEALKFHNKALEIHLKYPKKNIRGFIGTLKHIGFIYEQCGNYDEALQKYFHALNIVDTSLPENHPDGATIYKCIGTVYSELGQYNESMKNYQKSLRIQQETLPNDHPSLASTYIDVGYVYYLKGNYDHALNHYKQAHKILVNRGIIGRTELATVYGNMGIVYSKKGEYVLALDCQQKCLEIEKQFSSEQTKTIAITYSNISVLYNKTDKIERAMEYMQKAIDIIRNSQVPDDPSLGLCYNNIALNYEKLGDIEQALYYYNLSLDVKYRYFPVNHVTFATTFDNIALLYTKQGDISMAIYYQEKALKIFEESVDANHPARIACMQDLAILKTLDRRPTH